MVIKIKKLNIYVITYLLIAFAGIPFFDGNKNARFIFLLYLAGVFIYYKLKVDNKIVVILIIAMALVWAQMVLWAGSPVTMVTFIMLMVLTPYFAIKFLGPQFLGYYNNVMYYIAMIALGFWVATNAIPGFHGLTLKIGFMMWPFTPWPLPESIIVYTYEAEQVYGFYRNPGPFHEPGAYSVFLMLAVLSEIFTSKKLGTRRNMIYFANLLTTFSTAGFLGTFVILGFYVFTSTRLTLLTKYVLSLSMLGLIVVMFTQLEFLNEKITSQLKTQSEQRLHTATSGRFLGARKALVALERNPITGRGLIAASKADPTSEEAAGYGWITWMSRLGIIFGPMYMFFLYRTLRNYAVVNMNSAIFGVVAFMAMLAVLAGQKHTSALVFFSIFLTSILFPISTYWRDYFLKHDESKKSKQPPEKMSFEGTAKLSRIAKKERLY